MSRTSVSLLERLRLHSADVDWKRLVDIYTPLIEGWLLRHDVPAADADDLVQEILAVLVRELPQFEHNQRTGAFRAWLRKITVNRLRGYWRSKNHPARPENEIARQLDQLEDPSSGLSQVWDKEHDRHVLGRLMRIVEPEFPAPWWQAFRRHVLDEAPAARVAAGLGVTVNIVLLAKSRILRRLRQEGRGLLD